MALDVPQRFRVHIGRIEPLNIGDLHDAMERPEPASDVPGLFEHERRRRHPEGEVPLAWYSPAEVAALLGFGLSKVKMKIATGELRSIKDGKYRRILPEWVDEYIRDQIGRQEAA